jgi:hypothetical protein
MPVATHVGLADDLDILQNERVVDMDDTISMLDPDVSQFTTMLMKVGSSPAHSSKIEWLEDELFPRLAALAAGATNVALTLTVAAGQGAYFRVGDVGRNQATGEAFRVTAVAGDVLTVVRGLGNVAAAAMNNGDQILIVSNASAQGATMGTRAITKRVHQFNYQQIQRNPYGFTETLLASKLYGGNPRDRERQKKAIEHKRAIEQTLFWGARALDASGANPIGFSGGIIEFLSTNVKDVNGALTKTALDTYMRDILQHGSTNKVMFVAPVVAQALSAFLRDAWSPNTTGARLWGAKVDAFLSGAYGFQIPVFVKREWNDFSVAAKQYGGWAFIIDMDNVRLRPLRPTRLVRDIQANDADEYDEEYKTEFSFQLDQERTHGLLKGITG